MVTASTSTSPGTNIPLLSKNIVQQRVDEARALANLEQSVDDVNAQYIASCQTRGQSIAYRRLICMPLTPQFDPPMGIFSHGHIQTGDKMSLPKCFLEAITLNKAEVPWLFEVRRIDGVTGPRVEPSRSGVADAEEDDETTTTSKKRKKKASQTEWKPTDWGAAPPADETLEAVVGSCLDFRAPPNYIFLPWWMMRALGLKPRDVVDVRQITTVAPGGMVKFRPLTDQTLKDIANPQAVFETELRHYSSLTAGSTIAFDYNKKRYWFEVAECRSSVRGEKRPMIKCQDCDVATDYLPARDKVNARKKKLMKQQQDDDDDDE